MIQLRAENVPGENGFPGTNHCFAREALGNKTRAH